jgi:2,5-diamino-6-(ribosylamino)-4(3H)-pyrimidinone 5'-phosphate reductase
VKPRVICHMLSSVDGRIVVTGWKLPARAIAEYERTAETFGADAWMIGRISMEPYAGRARIPVRKPQQPLPRTDYVARQSAPSHAIALDPSGKLAWESGSIDEAHVISILTKEVSDDYLAFLRSKGVSYLFGGTKKLNLATVLGKLGRRFGIRKLLLEGGGKINGSFLAAGLIDELSVLVAPLADGAIGTPTLFDARQTPGPARQLKLLSCEKRAGDILWLRYGVKRR